MAAPPLILTLTVLTATILVLLILWVFIRYTKDRRARHSQSIESRLQLEQDAAYTADHGESRVHLHCTYQPSGAPHGAGHDGVELQTVKLKERKDDAKVEVDKAEVWLKRGASRDNLRSVSEEEGVLGTKTIKGWDVMGRPTEDGLEGAGRR
jgi:hypothetical protein